MLLKRKYWPGPGSMFTFCLGNMLPLFCRVKILYKLIGFYRIESVQTEFTGLDTFMLAALVCLHTNRDVSRAQYSPSCSRMTGVAAHRKPPHQHWCMRRKGRNWKTLFFYPVLSRKFHVFKCFNLPLYNVWISELLYWSIIKIMIKTDTNVNP